VSEDGAPRRLVLLRHGRTAWNLEGRAQGHTDVLLDAVGVTQARAAAPHLAAYRPTRIWTSDLARAATTAAIVGEAYGVVPVADPRLREYDVGVRTGLTLAELAVKHPDDYARWQAGDATPGGESDVDVAARALPALQEISAAVAPGECGLVVGHGGSLRVGVAAFLGWPLELRQALGALGNCHWFVLERELATFDGTDRWRLHAWNLSAPEEQLTPDFASDESPG